MGANDDFDNQGTYTIPSKMNSLDDDNLDFNQNDEAPF